MLEIVRKIGILLGLDDHTLSKDQVNAPQSKVRRQVLMS
jgi:hypothetical protein